MKTSTPWLLTLLAACGGATAPTAPQTTSDDAAVDHQAELPPAPAGDATHTPPAPGVYPEGPFGEAVKRGEALFMDTPGNAGRYVGSSLSCKNCHLDNGRTADSAPMWGAIGMYPAYRKKNDKVNTMEERIQGCFVYSMNAQDSEAGEPPPLGDPILTDIQAYAYWLGQGVPLGEAQPGRGFPELDAPAQTPDVTRGAEVYAQHCASCHGPEGQGVLAGDKVVFPPLWGEGGYNWGAGMHRVNTAAGFIWANMPFGQGRTLTEQQAWDVATFINSQERPADPRQTGAIADNDASFHDHDCQYGEDHDGRTLGEGLK